MVKICQAQLLKLNFEIIQQKKTFSGFCQKFSQAMHEVENFFCQFPNPRTLRVSSKCEKKSKSLHPNIHTLWGGGVNSSEDARHCSILYI
jgi:hypothetical protein